MNNEMKNHNSKDNKYPKQMDNLNSNGKNQDDDDDTDVVTKKKKTKKKKNKKKKVPPPLDKDKRDMGSVPGN